jgi:hypothetical protein
MASVEKGKAEAAGGEPGVAEAGSSAEGCSSGEPAAPVTEPSSGDSSVPRPSRGAASKYDFVKVRLQSNFSFAHEIRVQSLPPTFS